jgi:hypothetical protein
MAVEEHDEKTIRCPRMGDFIPFRFCRSCGDPFCWIIVRCWAPRIDIGGFLADNYEPDVIHKGLERPEGGRYKKIIELSHRYRSDK